MIWLLIIEYANGGISPVICIIKNIARYYIRIKEIRQLLYISLGRIVAASRAYTIRPRTTVSMSGSRDPVPLR